MDEHNWLHSHDITKCKTCEALRNVSLDDGRTAALNEVREGVEKRRITLDDWAAKTHGESHDIAVAKLEETIELLALLTNLEKGK